MLETIINIAIIILGFGVLIFFHELGHFIAAKWAGIRAEAFAVGMGPVIASWRKGIGLRPGSTTKAVDQRIHAHLEARGINVDSNAPEDQKRAIIYKAMEDLSIGETEYSLRWLPIGGFVKMLGQEDANPEATSTLKGSYQSTPIGKRMVVVSAGVIMNLILGVLFFIWAFMVGVPFEAPIVGSVAPGFPAAETMPGNAMDFGITEPGLKPGDRIVEIDGDEVNHFRDVAIASAMARTDRPLELSAERGIDGQVRTLRFLLTPEMNNGLLTLGLLPASSTRLYEDYPDDQFEFLMDITTLGVQGIEPGMELLSVNGQRIATFQEFEQVIEQSGGAPVATVWSAVDVEGELTGPPISATLPVHPRLVGQQWADGYDEGLLGLTPLVAIRAVSEGPNQDLLQPGDLILRIADVEGPRLSQLIPLVAAHEGEDINALIIRDGEIIELTLEVNGDGRIGIRPDYAYEAPYTAAPIEEFVRPIQSRDRQVEDSPGRGAVSSEESSNSDEPPIETVPSPVAGKDIYPGARIISINGIEVGNWREIREAFKQATGGTDSQSVQEMENGLRVRSTDPSGGTDSQSVLVSLEIELPQPTHPRVIVEIELSEDDIAALHDLGWRTDLASGYFESIQIVLTANGNPLRAIQMGFEETWTFVLHTYLTIDRLIRGTVGVEQLRGPVGIVHLGTTIAERGFMYIIFFLAMISVNLAVINFLPLPIVDGGLFLFLIYEKLKGRPPSIAFQNAATIAGLVVIVGLFLMVTYNDIARLVGG